MPLSDLAINVRQIAGYPPTGNAIASDELLLQRGGLGGPYVSITAPNFVGTALATGGDMAIGGELSVVSVSGASAMFSNANIALLIAQTANIGNLTATWGAFGSLTAPNPQFGALTVAGDMQVGGTANLANAVVQAQLTAGYLSVVQTLDATNLNVSNLATVGSLLVNGNLAVPNGTATVGGYPIVTTGNSDVSGLAPLASPAFTGTPTAPTPAVGTNSTQIATTAYVVGELGQISATYAPLASPQFSGLPSAPTAAVGTSTGQLATTAFVQAAVAASTAGVSSFNTRTGAVVLTTADVTGAGGAPVASPIFTGTPTAPTPAPGNNSTLLATTAFVQAAVAGLNIGVSSFNTRTGAVSLTTADITAAGGALATQAGVSSFNSRTGAITLEANDVSAAGGAILASPAFTGTPTAPTAAPATSTTQIATTAFVQAAISAGTGVTSFNSRTGSVTLAAGDVTGVGGALLASPAFSGTPTAPTPAPGNNSTQLATTAYVTAALAGAGVASFNGRSGVVTLTAADIIGAGGALATSAGVTSFNTRTGAITLIPNDISAAGGATLASPAFTGVPTGPTATAGTTTTQLATTAFVTAAIAASGVSSFNGRAGAVTLTTADITDAGGAPIATPIFTGQSAMISNATAPAFGCLIPGGTNFGMWNAAGSALSLGALSLAGVPTTAWVTVSSTSVGVPTGTSSIACRTSGGFVTINGASAFVAAGGQASLIVNGGGRATYAYELYGFSGGAATRFMTLDGGGNMVVLGTVTQGSDRAFKRNIASITGALAKVIALQGVAFDRLDGTHEIGLIAQDVEPVVPEVVRHIEGATDTEPKMGVAYAQLTALLIEAVKELAGRLGQLETRMAT
jgi:hypothetical protein